MNGMPWEQCQAFVMQVDQEHRRLRELLASLRRELEVAETTPAQPRLRHALQRSLAELRSSFASHVVATQRGSCIEEAACHCAGLGHDVISVEHEQVDLVHKLEELISGELLGEDHRLTLPEFDRFAANVSQLVLHEGLIVQHGFNYNPGD